MQFQENSEQAENGRDLRYARTFIGTVGSSHFEVIPIHVISRRWQIGKTIGAYNMFMTHSNAGVRFS